MKKPLSATLLVLPMLCGTIHAEPAQLDKVFTRENINVPFEKLEQITGKPTAIKDEGSVRRYQIGQCAVTVHSYDGKKTSSIELETITPDCTFNLANLIDVPKDTHVHQLTFGRFAQIAHDDGISANCLEGCPDEETSVSISWQTPESEKYLEIITRNNLTSPESKAAATKWVTFMKEQEGKQYKPNSVVWTLKHTKQGLAYFQDIPISSIRIGYCMLDCCHDEEEE